MNKDIKKEDAGVVHFVGAGPGDPELITVKGMRLLKEADIVVYAGSLVKERMLGWCRPGTEIHDSASMTLEEIMKIMVRGAMHGKRVVRLHTGDPSLYSAVREQAEILDKRQIPYDVVPGVSSASAAAAALKKELTVPGITQTVILTRLEGRTPVPDSERLSSLASHGSTLCIFLSIAMIDRVVEELNDGYPPQTPVAVVYRASWADEIRITGTLKDIAEKVKAAGIERQAVIIVGPALGDGASGAERSKLYDGKFSHGFRKG